MQSAEVSEAAGARITVFHPGYYQKHSRDEAYSAALKNLKEIEAEMKQLSLKVLLGAETVGKKAQFGGLEENLRLANELEQLVPVLDVAHIHARGDFILKTEDDYGKLFSHMEKELPGYMKSFHMHFSEIEYSGAGERRHLPLGTNNEPPFDALLNILIANGYAGTVICETPKIDIDAQEMKRRYEMRLKK